MTTSAGRPATTTPLDFVPELLDDFVRRDIDGETVVWAASAPQPVVLHPVTTVMLDVIDGRASIRELALDVHEEIGIPLETAQRQVIGVVEQLQKRLGMDSVLTGFGLPDCDAHSPNEKLHLPTWERGIDTLIYFFGNLA